MKSAHDLDEMLLYEDPAEDEEDIPDITSMLEVSIDEPNDNDDDIEVLELDENCSVDVSESAQLLLQEETTDIEIVSLDDDDEPQDNTQGKETDNNKPKSIKDLVNIWASEDETSTKEKKANRTSKRRNEQRG